MASLTQRLRGYPLQPTTTVCAVRLRSPVQRSKVVTCISAKKNKAIVKKDAHQDTSAEVVPTATEDVRLRVRMRGYDVDLLAQAVNQVHAIAEVTGAEFKGPVMLPTKRRLYCVLRSPHVHKDSREHFEIRIHHR